MALFQNLLSAFKGREEARVPLAPGFFTEWMPAFDGGGSSRAYRYESAVETGFLTNPVAQRAVRIVAEGIAQAPLSASDNDLASLVTATSAGQPFIETLAAHVLLHGNGFVQIIKDASGRPIELFALRPDRVKVITGSDGWPCAYEYAVAANTVRIPIEDEDGWPGIIHIKAMHPLDDHMGATAFRN
ncbi:phage portal protein [Erythrobacter insulae]|uniref:Phage portal protein n=1 Tax=Erythrobacter insulae TaxID=2584124 RepID=A0A547PBJ6_9SPHN|nr:phage portal protein [Erythrobacter insulae]TRD11512.1 phage portal protein [Erythrobacter insulae]